MDMRRLSQKLTELFQRDQISFVHIDHSVFYDRSILPTSDS
jgi:hypothetical protein